MSIKYVIARYNEDISWLPKDSENIIIYNKGEPLNIQNEILTKNVGRESETYLKYIIDNYNNLPDVVVFSQAKISDHINTNIYNDQYKYLEILGNEALINGMNTTDLLIILKEHPDIICHMGPEWNYKHGTDPDNVWYYHKSQYKNGLIKFNEWLEKHIDIKYELPFKVYCNAIFAVSKNNILKRNIEYYKKLISTVDWHINPIETHFLERSWYYIFA